MNRAGIAEFAAAPALSFGEKYQTALWNNTRLLGGYDASRLVDRCAELLKAEPRVTPGKHFALDILDDMSGDTLAIKQRPAGFAIACRILTSYRGQRLTDEKTREVLTNMLEKFSGWVERHVD